MPFNKLDNPAWYSLSEKHHELALIYTNGIFYHPDYCPFGGFSSNSQTSRALSAYAKLTDNFFVIGEKPHFSKDVVLKKELICDQMILENRISINTTESIRTLQTTNEKSELYNLVQLVQPGYFRRETASMGNYYGIYKNSVLIAVTGERMKMNDYTEVSAVVTHPDHLGNGYAKQLVKHTTDMIFEEGCIPYLHVAETNLPAIALYEKLGFKRRRKISFWNFVTAI